MYTGLGVGRAAADRLAHYDAEPEAGASGQRPHVSCAYSDSWAVALVADCRAEPVTDDAVRTHV